MSEDSLKRAIALCKIGKSLEARKILEEIVRAEPEKDIAWIWLANTYTENPDRIAVLNEWLKSNPKSLNARNWLAVYKRKPRKGEKSQKIAPEIQSNQILNYRGDETIPVLVRRSDKIRNNRKRNGNKRPFLIPAFAVGLLVLTGLGFLSAAIFHRQGSHASPIIVISPSSSPPAQLLTSSSTPSLTSTPFLSPTASPSSTPSPSFTDTPFVNTATVNIDRSYLYAGPSVDHELIQCPLGNCIYTKGTQVILLEKHEVYGETWFLVKTPDGNSGWLHEDWLLVKGDQNAVPTASAYPTYPPSATP
jgi:hypothetical protein